MSIYLDGPQIKSFVDALSQAFIPSRFDQLLLGRLNKPRFMITLAGDFVGILYDVIVTANNEGWALKLLDAARASNPSNSQLLAFEESLGLGAIAPSDKTNLEKVVNQRSTFNDPMSFRKRLGLLETWICAIEFPGGGGTGVLVGPDVILTNFHVIEPLVTGKANPANALCRFDYKAIPQGNTVNAGTSVALAADWDYHKSKYSLADLTVDGLGWTADELDFALVRLERAIGHEPIGTGAEIGAANRGWLSLSSAPPELAKNDVLFILQHPQDLQAWPTKLQPMRLAAGIVMGFVGNGLRVRHDTRTLPGSSGSPCFNASLELVALHHAGEPNNRLDYKGTYNQAIPLTEIVKYLINNGLSNVLDTAPPTPSGN